MFVITLLALVGAAISAPSAPAPRIVEGPAPNALALRIVGGSNANIEDYPFMAVLLESVKEYIQVRFIPFCGGTLITTRSVLTAAHCVFNNVIDNRHVRVRLGSSFSYFGGDFLRVQNWIKHPGYAFPKAYHDIAILKLAAPATLSSRVALAPIAGPNYLVPDNITVTAAGWGLLEFVEKTVLTTNHFRVRLGSILANFGGHLHRVENWIKHPGYTFPRLYHDIAILKLATPTTLSSRVALAPIVGPNYLVPDNTTVTAAAWGTLEFKGEPSEILQKVDIQKVNHDICRENYAELQFLLGEHQVPNVTSGMVCAGILGVGGKDACNGDSGGPLLHQGVVIGVTSWGHECAHPKYPGVFVNVPSYTSWIFENA